MMLSTCYIARWWRCIKGNSCMKKGKSGHMEIEEEAREI
jgi:hypothetical protein